MEVTNRGRGTVRNLLLVAMGFLLASATDATLGDWAEQPPRPRLPRIDPNSASGCTAEAAAYAAALVDLDDAQQIANDAYDAWHDCEQEQMTPDITPDPGTKSVLIRD